MNCNVVTGAVSELMCLCCLVTARDGVDLSWRPWQQVSRIQFNLKLLLTVLVTPIFKLVFKQLHLIMPSPIGVPAIVPLWSGITEFVSADYSLPLDVNVLEPAFAGEAWAIGGKRSVLSSVSSYFCS